MPLAPQHQPKCHLMLIPRSLVHFLGVINTLLIIASNKHPELTTDIKQEIVWGGTVLKKSNVKLD
jgi:hypothetical protein